MTSIQKRVEDYRDTVIFSRFKHILDNYMFHISTWTLLALFSRIHNCDCLLNFLCWFFVVFCGWHTLLGFVGQRDFSSVYDFFPSQISKLVYSFESLSLKPIHGNKAVYLTMLVPLCRGWPMKQITHTQNLSGRAKSPRKNNDLLSVCKLNYIKEEEAVVYHINSELVNVGGCGCVTVRWFPLEYNNWMLGAQL